MVFNFFFLIYNFYFFFPRWNTKISRLVARFHYQSMYNKCLLNQIKSISQLLFPNLLPKFILVNFKYLYNTKKIDQILKLSIIFFYQFFKINILCCLKLFPKNSSIRWKAWAETNYTKPSIQTHISYYCILFNIQNIQWSKTHIVSNR